MRTFISLVRGIIVSAMLPCGAAASEAVSSSTFGGGLLVKPFVSLDGRAAILMPD